MHSVRKVAFHFSRWKSGYWLCCWSSWKKQLYPPYTESIANASKKIFEKWNYTPKRKKALNDPDERVCEWLLNKRCTALPANSLWDSIRAQQLTNGPCDTKEVENHPLRRRTSALAALCTPSPYSLAGPLLHHLRESSRVLEDSHQHVYKSIRTTEVTNSSRETGTCLWDGFRGLGSSENE